MKKQNLYQQSRSPFESIRKYNSQTRAEYWMARELMDLLGYEDWGTFKKVIGRAWHCCNKNLQYMAKFSRDNARETSDKHFFPLLQKHIQQGEKVRAERALDNDYKLSRYACYLVAINASPRYKGVAEIQNYFTIATRIFQAVDEITPILSLPAPSDFLGIKNGLIFVGTDKIASALGIPHRELFEAIASLLKSRLPRQRRDFRSFRDGEEVKPGYFAVRMDRHEWGFILTEVAFAKTMAHLEYLFPELAEKIVEVESIIAADFEAQKQPFLKYVRTVVLPEPEKRKYVYILHNEVTNLYKIGITDDLRRRRMQLTGACGVELNQVFAIKTEDANEIEEMLHRIFSPYRQQGEWFAIPKDEIGAIASSVEFKGKLLPHS